MMTILHKFIFFKFELIKWGLGIGDWGLGFGDWGLGFGDWAQSPIPNPQSPIPNPQSPFICLIIFNLYLIIKNFLYDLSKFIQIFFIF